MSKDTDSSVKSNRPRLLYVGPTEAESEARLAEARANLEGEVQFVYTKRSENPNILFSDRIEYTPHRPATIGRR